MLAKYIQDANTEYRRIQQRIPLGPLRTAADYSRAVEGAPENRTV
jgi:hypothetical protein